MIAKHFSVDKDLLEAEQKIFMKFMATSDDLLQQAVSVPKIVEIARKQGDQDVLFLQQSRRHRAPRDGRLVP